MKQTMIPDVFGLDLLFSDVLGSLYETSDIAEMRGLNSALANEGNPNHSAINKLHTINLANGIPALEKNYNNSGALKHTTCYELCTIPNPKAGYEYDVEDFLYCKNIGLPINRMVTLRRFAYPVRDNIITRNNNQSDICRLVAFCTDEVNKLDDITSFSYGLKWKQLEAEMSQAQMLGANQSGVNGMMRSFAAILDPTSNKNALSGMSSGANPMSQYDPKHDNNRVYGPVDSIATTHIRDVGLEFEMDLNLQFDYVLRSVGGKSGAYVMRDILGNILACTFNTGKFWGGARYWVGEKPSPWARKLQFMNSGDIDTILSGFKNIAKEIINKFSSVESALDTLKQIVKGGFAVMMGRFLDTLGRPGIPVVDSLLSSSPTGYWHVTIGNPLSPIISIGNLILDSSEIKFGTEMALGDVPTELSVTCKLKPGQPKDRAGIETMLNGGQKRIYWKPKKIKLSSKDNINRKHRRVIGGRDDAAAADKAKYIDMYPFQKLQGEPNIGERNEPLPTQVETDNTVFEPENTKYTETNNQTEAQNLELSEWDSYKESQNNPF